MEERVGVTDEIICAYAKMVSLGTSARCVSDFALPHKSALLALVQANSHEPYRTNLLVFVTT